MSQQPTLWRGVHLRWRGHNCRSKRIWCFVGTWWRLSGSSTDVFCGAHMEMSQVQGDPLLGEQQSMTFLQVKGQSKSKMDVHGTSGHHTFVRSWPRCLMSSWPHYFCEFLATLFLWVIDHIVSWVIAFSTNRRSWIDYRMSSPLSKSVLTTF